MIDGTQSTSSGFMQLQMKDGGSTTQTTFYYGFNNVNTGGTGYSVGGKQMLASLGNLRWVK
jgi:hypothetical protein